GLHRRSDRARRPRGPHQSAVRSRGDRRAAAPCGVHQRDRAADRRRTPATGALSDGGRARRGGRPARDLPDPVDGHPHRHAGPLSNPRPRYRATAVRRGCICTLRLYNGGALFALRRARPVGVALVVTLLALVAGGAAAQETRTPTAIITMEKGGEIVLEFYTKDAPRHVENFVSLAKKKFYDGQRVHRVEPNFVVQFGDPQSKTKP